MKERNHDHKWTNEKVIARKLDAAGWSLFFIWTGIAFLANIGWGLGLLGVSIITLGGQTVRKYFGLKLEGFWVAVGFAFLGGGIWKLFHIQLGLLPILCIVSGVVLFVSALVRDREINRTGRIGTCLK